MVMTDPIADMLTRIRNAIRAGHTSVAMPASKMKVGIAQILKEEGYVDDYRVEEGAPCSSIHLDLRFCEGQSVIRSIRRISKGGCRVYRGYRDLPRVLNGLGIAIVSTTNGVLSDGAARSKKIGGEILCEVY